MSATPVHPGDFPDPFVLNVDGRFFAYGTNTGGVNVQVLSSDDLVLWRPLGDALPLAPAGLRPASPGLQRSWPEAGDSSSTTR